MQIINMVFTAYLLEKNAILVLSQVGHLHPSFKPTVGFVLMPVAPPWGVCSFPEHNDKCPINAREEGGGEEWAYLELTEP